MLKCYHIHDFCTSEDMPLHVALNNIGVTDSESEHLHDFLEIVYVESGSGWMGMNGKSTPAFPGDVYIMPISTIHAFQVFNRMKYYNILVDFRAFSPEEIRMLHENERFVALFADPTASPVYFRPPFQLTTGIRRFLSLAADCIQRRPPGFKSDLKAYVTLMLNEISRLPAKYLGSEMNIRKDARYTRNISEAAAYMTENFRYRPKLGDMAARWNMTPDNFTRFFRKQTGATPMQYLNKLRIFEAARLLSETPSDGSELIVSEIASECGFNNTSYFSEIFRKVMGCSPTRFRTRSIAVRHMTSPCASDVMHQ